MLPRLRWFKLLTLAAATISVSALFADEPLPLPRQAEAESSPPAIDNRSLTLLELQELAIQNNPTLEQARAETWKAHGRQVQAGLYPNPVFGYTAGEIGNDGRAGQQGFLLQQEFVTGGKLRLDQSIAYYEQQQAQQTVTAQEYRIRNSVRAEFYTLLTANRKQELAGDLLDLARAAEQRSQQRLEGLQGSRVDLLQARLERQRAELQLENAEVERVASLRRLQTLIGIQPDAIRLEGKLEENVPDLAWDETWTRLEELSPLIARARVGVARARMVHQRACVEPIPNVTVQGNTQYDFSTETPIAGLQVSVPLPLFNKNQGNIASAEADWLRASQEVERTRLRLRQSLAEIFQDYQRERNRVLKYSTTILPSSWETLDLSRQALENGEINALQYLTVQRNYTLLNQDYVTALGAIWQHVVAIDGLLLMDGLQAPESSGQ